MANRLPVNPTRMELLRMRKRLVVAQRGHKLLKDKLEGMMKDFVRLAGNYKAQRKAVAKAWPEVRQEFGAALALSSPAIIGDALEAEHRPLTLRMETQRIMGVPLPQFRAEFGAPAGACSLVHTPVQLDTAITETLALFPVLLQLAESEQAVRLLAREIERTRRRVNALEHTVIPRIQTTVRFIAGKLDEMERSNTVRLMKIKAMRTAAEAGENAGL
ncbi:MAG: V-type ATP synthase subunit D [Candidatus Hydrogenedentes bacterium]|nr:V-type ATP synthase subunit D [Candidatus Hydrogenedentota bacterium]